MTSTTPAQFDVFISHATADDLLVTRIHHALTAAGITAWVDHEHGIAYGSNWDRAIHNAVNTCRAGLLVLSPTSAKSEYCIAEWNRILNIGHKLYVAMIEYVPLRDVPVRIDTLQRADLTVDFDGTLQKLIDVMSGRATSGASASITNGGNMISGPFPRSERDLPIFGREVDQAKTSALLAGNARLVTLLGLGGVGKTRLALEIAITVGITQFHDGVIWHKITDSPRDLATLTYLIREHFGLSISCEDDIIWRELDRRETLIILDNAEACKTPAQYVARINQIDLAGGTRVLMTSRVLWKEIRNQKYHDLHAPSAEAAVKIMQAMADMGRPTFSLNWDAAVIAKAARYHPRLMQYAVAWLNDYPPVAVEKQLTTLKGTDAVEALDDMIFKTIVQVREQPGGDSAVMALRCLAAFRGGFTYEAAQALLNHGGAPIDIQVISILKRCGLLMVDAESQRYEIEPLVAAALGEDEAVFAAHYAYYKTLAETHDQRQDYVGLDPESANLEIAFERTLNNGQVEDAYWFVTVCRRFLENRGRFTQELDWVTRCWKALQNSSDGSLRAALQNSLGIAYQMLPTGDRQTNLRQAIAAYYEALRFRTAEIDPINYAMSQNALGTAFIDLAAVESRTVNLTYAIEAFHEALRFRTADTAPLDYAMTQNNLGGAYGILAAVEDRATNLIHAVTAYREALRFLNPEGAPLSYAATQYNLGNLYGALATIENRAINLTQAISAYREALRFYTPNAAPLDYARTQTNLGNTYRALAIGKDRVTKIRQAISAYNESSRFYTAESRPLKYAATQYNLGNAYADLAAVENRTANLAQAIDAYAEALRFYTPKDTPLDYAMTQHVLGNAYWKTVDLAGTINAWREAEKYYRLIGNDSNANKMRRGIDGIEARLLNGTLRSN